MFNSHCISHEMATGPFGLLHDLIWWIFISMSEELLPIYLANMFAEFFSENMTRNIMAIEETNV
jgi:hypothetical protein